MSLQLHAPLNRSPSTSRELQIVAIGGIIHALLVVGIRAVAGVPTGPSLSSYLGWALIGGFIVGASFTGLYVRGGSILPSIVTLVLLVVGGGITYNMYASLDGAVPAFAWTPMTIYVTYWPIILGVAVLVGLVEWVGRQASQRFL